MSAMSTGKRQTAVVICPGRGTYTKTELGYLKRYRGRYEVIDSLLSQLDSKLAGLGEPTISDLDNAAQFSLKTHTPGEYASTLIYACSAADFLAIDRQKYDIVAVTGNSMGWYTALSIAGALDVDASFKVIHTMGSMMRGGIIGGQLIYPVVDKDWKPDQDKIKLVAAVLQKANQQAGGEAFISIRFGGYTIIGGNEVGLKYLMQHLPPEDEGRYPFILVNHAAFHTPLLRSVSETAFKQLPVSLFQAPATALIDGRGAIWQPYATDVEALYQYTLGHQVYEPYDFTTAITVALKEFAPDKLILLGPGSTSGGAIAQILIENRWKSLASKTEFSSLQEKTPFLLAMGREDQRTAVL